MERLEEPDDVQLSSQYRVLYLWCGVIDDLLQCKPRGPWGDEWYQWLEYLARHHEVIY